jgi:hypothetical protein
LASTSKEPARRTTRAGIQISALRRCMGCSFLGMMTAG